MGAEHIPALGRQAPKPETTHARPRETLARQWHGCKTCALAPRAAATPRCESRRLLNTLPVPSVSHPAGRARPGIFLRALHAGTTGSRAMFHGTAEIGRASCRER